MHKEYWILAVLIALWVYFGAIIMKYDYKTWPDKPGINCINLDNPSIWPSTTLKQ
jgi:hypothetical protein